MDLHLREALEKIFQWMIIGMCLNIGLAVVSEGFGVSFGPAGGSNDWKTMMTDAINENDKLSKSVNSCPDPNATDCKAGFNPALIFGDFMKGLGIVLNAISFQYFVNILQVFGFNSTFVLGIRAIGAILGTFAIFYIISGRW